MSSKVKDELTEYQSRASPILDIPPNLQVRENSATRHYGMQAEVRVESVSCSSWSSRCGIGGVGGYKLSDSKDCGIASVENAHVGNAWEGSEGLSSMKRFPMLREAVVRWELEIRIEDISPNCSMSFPLLQGCGACELHTNRVLTKVR